MKELVQDMIVDGHRIASALHDAGGKRIVIFCHGFRGTSVGPNRFFVTVARKLAEQGISALRFDQYGSGNSEGDFFDSSFLDWIQTTKTIAGEYLQQGYRVALFGQSMGASTVIAVGSELSELSAIVAWSPDPNIETFVSPESWVIEEGGQRVHARFWKEAHDAKIAEKLARVEAPMYIIQCTADEYVDDLNRNAIIKSAQSNHRVENFEGYFHTKWTHEQAKGIIDKSVWFLLGGFDNQ